MKIKFGEVTTSEIWVMLTASAESGDSVAERILNHQKASVFSLTVEDAEYLANRMEEDAERVAEAIGDGCR